MDFSFGAGDKLHESEVSQSLMFCLIMLPGNSCLIRRRSVLFISLRLWFAMLHSMYLGYTACMVMTFENHNLCIKNLYYFVTHDTNLFLQVWALINPNKDMHFWIYFTQIMLILFWALSYIFLVVLMIHSHETWVTNLTMPVTTNVMRPLACSRIWFRKEFFIT